MNRWRSLAARCLPESWRARLKSTWRNWGPLPPLHLTADRGPSVASPFAHWVTVPNELTVLGEKYQPTKRLHNYLPLYWIHLRDIRHSVRNVLEIGVQTDRSLRMWEEFFPQARVYGMDINPECRKYASDRGRIFIGDQSSPRFLGECLEQIGGNLDVIIDDGSHLVRHQITSFNYLFPALTSHGVYVVEDTGPCVEDYRLRTVGRLQELISQIMYWPPEVPIDQLYALRDFPAGAKWAARNVAGIAFYRWIVFILRGHNPGDNPHVGPGSRTP